MPYLAAIEVDRRQQVIAATDKLKELLGGSWNIEETVRFIRELQTPKNRTFLLQPVSGAVWLTSSDLAELREVLWQFRKHLVDELELPCTFAIVAYGDLNRGREETDERVRQLKQSKGGGDGRPHAPLFASCLIQPDRPANVWEPKWEGDDQNERRKLLSSSSDQRFKKGGKTLARYLERFPEYKAKKFQEPLQFEHFAVGKHDQYLAMIRADGDGMSKVFASVQWDTLAANLKWAPEAWKKVSERSGWPEQAAPETTTPEQAMTRFGWAVEDCIWNALQAAASRVVGSREGYFPLAPIIRAGEDTTILCRRDIALDLAVAFGEEYAKGAGEDEVLGAAIRTANLEQAEALSMSMGVLFAREKFPFEIMWDLAEELEDNAKRRRREAQEAQEDGARNGWIDYFWLQSSSRESIEDARSGLFLDGGREYRLYSRPWTMEETAIMQKIARSLEKIPPRKWVQLANLLRFGHELSDLAYRRWLLQLSESERSALLTAMEELKKSHERLAPSDATRSPWRLASESSQPTYSTCLFEISELIKSTDLE